MFRLSEKSLKLVGKKPRIPLKLIMARGDDLALLLDRLRSRSSINAFKPCLGCKGVCGDFREALSQLLGARPPVLFLLG
jgi:hypothetical protein